MVLSNCAVCGSKQSRFIKELKAKGLLGSTLGKIIIIIIVKNVGNINLKNNVILLFKV